MTHFKMLFDCLIFDFNHAVTDMKLLSTLGISRLKFVIFYQLFAGS